MMIMQTSRKYRASGRYLAATLAAYLMAACPVFATPAQSPASNMDNCVQDNSSAIAIRACTLVLASASLSPAERVRIYMRRSMAWIIEEEPSAAVEDYSHVLEIEPKNLDALKGRARASALAGDHATAVAGWTQVIADLPANDAAYRGRGASQLALGNHDEALADYTKSLEINPKDVKAYIGRANVYDALKDRQKALKEFDSAIAVDPNFIRVYWVRGEMADSWGEKDIAIASYVKVLALNGVYEDARRRLQKLGILHPP